MRLPSLRIARRVLGALALLCAASAAQAQLVIEITRGQENAVPIAVVPFGNETGAAAPFDLRGGRSASGENPARRQCVISTGRLSPVSMPRVAPPRIHSSRRL